MIVPQGAGGGTDSQARQLVEAMKQVSGNNNIVVENVTGGCFRGICAPKDTPDEVKTYLADVIEKAYNSDSFQNWMKENGLLGEYSRLGDFEAYNQEMVEMLKPIIQVTGLAKGEFAQ